MAEKPARWRRRILIAVVLLAAVGLVGRYWFGRRGVAQGSWVLLDLEGDYSEGESDNLARLFGERPLSMLDLLMVIRDAGEDPRVAGLVVRVRPLAIGWAKARHWYSPPFRFALVPSMRSVFPCSPAPLTA